MWKNANGRTDCYDAIQKVADEMQNPEATIVIFEELFAYKKERHTVKLFTIFAFDIIENNSVLVYCGARCNILNVRNLQGWNATTMGEILQRFLAILDGKDKHVGAIMSDKSTANVKMVRTLFSEDNSPLWIYDFSHLLKLLKKNYAYLSTLISDIHTETYERDRYIDQLASFKDELCNSRPEDVGFKQS